VGNNPDWGRFGLQPPSQFEKVGDPTRWGAQVTPFLDPANLPTPPIGFQRFQVTDQIVLASTADPYARPWSIIGTLTLPFDAWNGNVLAVTLECTMGVGQQQIVQEILLMQGSNGTPVGFLGGLCLQQSTFNNGPYLPIPEPTRQVVPTGLFDSCRPFAIIGALIGHTINIRAKIYASGAPGVPVPGCPCTARIALLATPIAAGTGL
jgi:hypothetical protein